MSRSHHRRGRVHIPHSVLHGGHRLATGSAFVVVALLALDQRYGWLRHSPGGEAFDLNEQPYFLALFAIGVLVALRWRLIGGALTVFTSAGLIVFANRQLRTVDAVLVLAGFAFPAVVWVVVGLFERRDEQFHRSPEERPRPLLYRRDVLGGAMACGVVFFGGAWVSRWLFDRIYGPTHPSSTVAAVRGSSTRWVWSGAVTTRSAAVTTRLEDDVAQKVRLLVSRSDTLRGALSIDGVSNDEGLVRVDVDDLQPGTEYHYAFVVDGEIDQARLGRFNTHPEGPTSLGVVVGSCARTGSNASVFDTMRSLDPDLVVLSGDIHYADIRRDDQQAFRQVMDHTLSQPAQQALYQRSAVAYVWDDHDYGGADRDSGSRPAAMVTYRQFVPHYPLASTTSAIYQSFSFGRVRFLLTDGRSDRRPGDDGEPGTMLGPDQKQWLLDELLAARDSHALTIWANPLPWIAAAVDDDDDGDHWGAFAAERAEISQFIAENHLAPSLLMVSGDAHMLAIDDGTNSDFSGTGQGAFPVFHCAALDRPGSVKGGPYSHGAIPGGGQFGYISIDDQGEELAVVLTGRNWRNEVLITHEFTV